ncbi:hypothetical protein IT774_15070 [Salinimonas marina]|uniref:Uncharacterized protein n=1 Tax=Salinimonas marina TaxID=2785918 RepID=A0A7S9HDB4_9ALTE|nr:hypothetical protein [Salinimonas marina]QPG05401.1 hypothetical protein IT774_15070 [Salinimonas marina]
MTNVSSLVSTGALESVRPYVYARDETTYRAPECSPNQPFGSSTNVALPGNKTGQR